MHDEKCGLSVDWQTLQRLNRHDDKYRKMTGLEKICELFKRAEIAGVEKISKLFREKRLYDLDIVAYLDKARAWVPADPDKRVNSCI